MLTIGQDLYRLTARDEETLLVDPWFKVRSATIAAGSIQSQVNFTDLPQDRALYLNRLVFDIYPGAAQTVAQVQVYLTDRIPGASPIYLWTQRGSLTGDGNASAAAGVSIGLNVPLNLVLPPGVVLNVNVAKSVNVNEGTFNIYGCGYLIPPGRIGRGV